MIKSPGGIMTYKIVRFYQNNLNIGKRTIQTGLTLEEAQKHCNDPETSSTTCTKAKNRRITQRNGPWFDGYDKE